MQNLTKLLILQGESDIGAGEGNRTLISGLGSPHSTTEPHPLRLTDLITDPQPSRNRKLEIYFRRISSLNDASSHHYEYVIRESFDTPRIPQNLSRGRRCAGRAGCLAWKPVCQRKFRPPPGWADWLRR